MLALTGFLSSSATASILFLTAIRRRASPYKEKTVVIQRYLEKDTSPIKNYNKEERRAAVGAHAYRLTNNEERRTIERRAAVSLEEKI